MREEGEEEEEAILTHSLPFRGRSRSGLVLASRERDAGRDTFALSGT